jgi:hypothetical protein
MALVIRRSNLSRPINSRQSDDRNFVLRLTVASPETAAILLTLESTSTRHPPLVEAKPFCTFKFGTFPTTSSGSATRGNSLAPSNPESPAPAISFLCQHSLQALASLSCHRSALAISSTHPAVSARFRPPSPDPIISIGQVPFDAVLYWAGEFVFRQHPWSGLQPDLVTASWSSSTWLLPPARPCNLSLPNHSRPV